MVSVTPDGVRRLIAAGHQVSVQMHAGRAAGWSDDEYRAVQATVTSEVSDMMQTADIVVTVDGEGELARWSWARPGTVVVGMLKPYTAPLEFFQTLAGAKLSAMSLDSLPRISRAQSMDVLSSLSTVTGYRAVIVAAERLKRFFPLLMTAAGTIAPARVLVLGAGVAGLQAIATAHRLGAVVEAFDTRPEVREQVESLGATFLTLDVTSGRTADGYAAELVEDAHRRETTGLLDPVARADVIITAAQIPGQRAPILITKSMLQHMKPGSVVVDLAADSGGNTEVTQADAEVDYHGVRIIGAVNLAWQLAQDASQLFSRNVTAFIGYLSGLLVRWDIHHRLDMPADDLVARTLIVQDGIVLHPAVQQRLDQGGEYGVLSS
ncbi:MAG: NAD(P)(+) transhydrogenase (Re/Si-specific) subunit alpha [Sulfobacillus acidophilus]|uniref:proton-translocating NAD(P)(+) transhydrogenase n=1 Tax=Sulfobacillus acidophilus TaxID=53633 RepID=A0A2T2WGU9_9FIRM|nr:MAG: NAD(P)(+) transhydrogenase (Re/Si-specific) subunit alpha [Sulfobacillus acidophilus]